MNILVIEILGLGNTSVDVVRLYNIQSEGTVVGKDFSNFFAFKAKTTANAGHWHSIAMILNN